MRTARTHLLVIYDIRAKALSIGAVYVRDIKDIRKQLINGYIYIVQAGYLCLKLVEPRVEYPLLANAEHPQPR